MQPTTNAPNLITRIFISPKQPRLRAGWRLLVQGILAVVLTLIIVIPIGIVIFILEVPATNLELLDPALSGISLVLSVYLARRFIDRKTFSSLGFKLSPNTIVDLISGILISGLMMATIYAIFYSLGWLTFNGFVWEAAAPQEALNSLTLWIGIFLAVGFYEEILSRGYHLQNLEEGLNTAWAVFLSSGIFGMLHIFNPNATLISTLGILLAGYFLAYGYIRTRQLWLSIGLHIGWNIFEGPVFGFKVSGLDTGGLLLHDIIGPELWTGGPFGPEAGLVMLPVIAIGALIIFVTTQGRLEEKS